MGLHKERKHTYNIQICTSCMWAAVSKVVMYKRTFFFLFFFFPEVFLQRRRRSVCSLVKFGFLLWNPGIQSDWGNVGTSNEQVSCLFRRCDHAKRWSLGVLFVLVVIWFTEPAGTEEQTEVYKYVKTDEKGSHHRRLVQIKVCFWKHPPELWVDISEVPVKELIS